MNNLIILTGITAAVALATITYAFVVLNPYGFIGLISVLGYGSMLVME